MMQKWIYNCHNVTNASLNVSSEQVRHIIQYVCFWNNYSGIFVEMVLLDEPISPFVYKGYVMPYK